MCLSGGHEAEGGVLKPKKQVLNVQKESDNLTASEKRYVHLYDTLSLGHELHRNSTVLSQNRQLLSHGFQSHSYTNTMQANPVYFCQIPAGSLYCACYSNIAQSKATVLAKTPKKSILGSWMGSSGMSH